MNKLMTWVVAGVVGLSLTAASFDAEAQKQKASDGLDGARRHRPRGSRRPEPPLPRRPLQAQPASRCRAGSARSPA